MTGFLAGLVQRGASVPARAESPAVAAPAADGNSAYALEAPPREDAAQTEQTSSTPRDAAPERLPTSVVHITQVNAAPLSPPRDAVQPVAESTPFAEALRATPFAQSDEPVRPPKQDAGQTPQARRESADAEEPPRETHVTVKAARPIAVVPAVDRPAEPNAPPAAPASKLPEVSLTAAPAAPRELPRIASPTQLQTPPSAPPIHVRIGRVEVKPAAAASAPAAPKNASAAPALGFAAYRRLRTYRM